MRFYLFIFYFLMFLTNQLLSQGTIHLLLKDPIGQPIEGVIAVSKDQKRSSTTDVNGKLRWVYNTAQDTMILMHLNYVDKTIVVEQSQTVLQVRLTPHENILKAAEISSTWTKPNSIIVHTTLHESTLMQKNMAIDVPYLLQHLPSTVSTSDAGNGIGYTGIRIRGLDPTQINVLINGVPLNDAESQNVFWVDLPDLIASASAVQVQRGIGLSGSGQVAFGSSILINTNKFSLKPFMTVELGAGSFNTYKSSLAFGTGNIKNNWNIQGRLSMLRSAGYIDRASTQLWSGSMSISNITAKRSLRWHLFDGLEKTYQAWYGVPIQYIESNNRTYNAAGTEKSGSPHANQIDRYRQTHLQFIHNEMIARSWSMQNIVHYTPGQGYFEEYKSDQLPIDYLLKGIDPIDLVRRRNLNNDFFGTIHSAHYTGAPFDIQFGVSWNTYLGRHFGEVIETDLTKLQVPTRYYDHKASKRSAMAFGKLEYQLGLLQVIGDIQYRTLRYQYVPEHIQANTTETVNHEFLNPKVGLAMQMDGNNQLYLFSGLAHREPGREDYIKAGNIFPKVEKVWDNELGWRWLSSQLTFEQNLYYMSYRNQLVPTGQLNDVGAYIRSNVASSYRLGSETSIQWKVHKIGSISGNINLSQNRTRSLTEFIDDWDTGTQESMILFDKPIAYSPNQIINMSAQINILNQAITSHQHRLDFEMQGQSIGSQYLDGTGSKYSQLKGYQVINTQLYYTVSKKNKPIFDIRLQVNNLWNNQYESNGWIYRFKSPGYNPLPDDPYTALEGGDQYHQKGLFPQAGRHAFIGLRIFL